MFCIMQNTIKIEIIRLQSASVSYFERPISLQVLFRTL